MIQHAMKNYCSCRRNLPAGAPFWLLLLAASTLVSGPDPSGQGAEPATRLTARVRLAPGNGIWLKPATTRVPGHESELIAAIQAHAIKHIFLWTVGYTEARYAIFEPFIRQAHAHGLTVHALCAMKQTVLSQHQLSPDLLAKAISQITAYNARHPDAAFDGAQLDLENVSGPDMLQLLKQVHVPPALILSAAIQPDEFYPDMESSWPGMIRETDLSLLVPMLYTMDDIFYKHGTARPTLDIARFKAKTANILSRLPTDGSLMIGLSGYDREFPIFKSTGSVDQDYLKQRHNGDGFSEPAFSPYSAYGVPLLLAADKPLVSVVYQTNTGLSFYRFDFDTNRWMDVIETSPLCLRRAIAAGEQGGAGDPRYVGACVWLWHTVFDSSSGRLDGLTADHSATPQPRAAIELLDFREGLARLRITLTNANPTQRILGARASAGVFLRLEDASFVAVNKGTFHAAEAFDFSGRVPINVNGARIIELRRSFFEDPDSQQARSGEITVAARAFFRLDYRAWMTSKESLCQDAAGPQPYVARSPDDLHYEDSSRFTSYATFTTNLTPGQSGSR